MNIFLIFFFNVHFNIFIKYKSPKFFFSLIILNLFFHYLISTISAIFQFKVGSSLYLEIFFFQFLFLILFVIGPLQPRL